jgi:hypothetical protein
VLTASTIHFAVNAALLQAASYATSDALETVQSSIGSPSTVEPSSWSFLPSITIVAIHDARQQPSKPT